jgi:hypothetical protein
MAIPIVPLHTASAIRARLRSNEDRIQLMIVSFRNSAYDVAMMAAGMPPVHYLEGNGGRTVE